MKHSHPKIYLYKRIVQAKLFIDRHFNENIDLANIANEACFSKFHFIRLFKTVYGKTPHQYLIKVRIDQAKALLQQGSSVNNVCIGVGFDSVPSFTALFRHYTKLSPSVYRQIFLNRQQEIRESPLHFIPNCFAEKKGWAENSNFQEAQ